MSRFENGRSENGVLLAWATGTPNRLETI